MSSLETNPYVPGENVQLTTFDLRVLDVMNTSRASQEDWAKWHAESAIEIYEREDVHTTFRSIASSEARALSKRMLRLDRQRLLPVRKPVRLSRSRDWDESAYLGRKTHEITTPLLFKHDVVNVANYDVSDFSVDLTSGWKFTTITHGNDLRHALACATTPNPGDTPPRKARNLITDFIVADRSTGTEAIVESNVYSHDYSRVDTYPERDIVDANDERFVIQTGILRAARLAFGDEISAIPELEL